jgi:hypothetical protein
MCINLRYKDGKNNERSVERKRSEYEADRAKTTERSTKGADAHGCIFSCTNRLLGAFCVGAFFIGFWPIFGYKVHHKYP